MPVTQCNRDPFWALCLSTLLVSLQVYLAEATGPALSGLQSHRHTIAYIKSCTFRRHRVWKAFESQPLSLSSVCIQARQRPPLVKVSSCQGGYAPPSLGVRGALRIKHALDFGARSALMLVTQQQLVSSKRYAERGPGSP